MAKVVVLIGPPGAGKTTHAALLAAKLYGRHINCGDIARRIGGMDAAVAKGELSPMEDEIRAQVRHEIEHCEDPYIFLEGFPRTEEQLTLLEQWISTYHGNHMPTVFELAVDPAIIYERVAERARDGEDREVISRRLMSHYTTTAIAMRKLSNKKWNRYRVGIHDVVETAAINKLLLQYIKDFYKVK